MVTESRPYTEEEIATEQALATQVLKQGQIPDGSAVSESAQIPGQLRPMTYHIPASDQGSWLMVWELKVDRDGQVYGEPTKAPRGQLGLWLTKKRADGGLRFTTEQPSRIKAEAQYPCLHQDCSKRMYTRQDMVLHVKATHPREAELYEELLKTIMKAAAEDNPRVAEIAKTVAGMQERGVVSMEVNPTVREDKPDLTLGKPVIQSLGIVDSFDCPLCEWKPKPETQSKKNALRLHAMVKHKGELE